MDNDGIMFVSSNKMKVLMGSNDVTLTPISSEEAGMPYWLGTAMISVGQPINYLKPIGALGSKPGSSIASYALSKLIPGRFTTLFGRSLGTKIATKVGTNTIGRFLGRGVPILGGWITVGTIFQLEIPSPTSFLRF
jgi:hypothetical protein